MSNERQRMDTSDGVNDAIRESGRHELASPTPTAAGPSRPLAGTTAHINNLPPPTGPSMLDLLRRKSAQLDQWANQYTEGENNSDEITVSGRLTFLLARFMTSYSPSTGAVHVEFKAGTGEYGTCAFHVMEQTADAESLVKNYVIECKKIGHVVIQPNYHPNFEKGTRKTWEVVIIPRSCLGPGGLNRRRPRTISFAWPDKPVDGMMGGLLSALREGDIVGERTYLLFLRSLLEVELCRDEQLLTDLTDTAPLQTGIHPASPSHCEAVLLPVPGSRLTEKTPGIIYFTAQGHIFFSCRTAATVRVFIPHTFVRGGFYRAALPVRGDDQNTAPQPGAMELQLNVVERPTERFAEGSIKFVDMPLNMFPHVKDFLEEWDYGLLEVGE